MQDKWIINKVGLLNFWYYDEEEFHFSNGRLLLRGSNGSGKSVTMQSFIPLLLDGNRSPERLDPFGSRARKMDNYLLGEDENGQDERTGYLYMEFAKKDSGRYLTIGMGFQARRGKPLNSWGFSLTDGRRIGKDFFLYKEMGDKVPLSKIELRNRVANGGEFYDSQGNYMEMVNKLLFGFENIEEYDELVKLLVQLRTPKLSKDFKPTVIYDIMNNAIQPLSDEDLRPMSEAIENMDNIKTQLEALKESKAAADKLKSEYDRYNRFLLLEKAKTYLNAQKELKDSKEELEKQQNAMEEFHSAYKEAEEKIDELNSRQTLYEHKKQKLEKHDSYQAKIEIDKREEKEKELQKRHKAKKTNLEEKQEREKKLQSQYKNLEEEYQYLDKEINTILKEMAEFAEEFKFDEHSFASEEIAQKPPREYDFTYLKNELLRYRERIAEGLKKLAEEKKQKVEYDRALQILDQAKKEKDDASRELERVQSLFDETRDEYLEKVYRWEKNNLLLKLSEEEMQNLSRIVRSYGEGSSFDDILVELRKKTSLLESNINRENSSIEATIDSYQEELQEKEKELEEWKKKKDPEPPREEKVLRNRERLAEEGIPFLPFYKAVDFRDDLSQEARGVLEEALIDMGLLDALIVPEEYREEDVLNMDRGMADKYIFSNPQYMTHELSLFLKAEKVEDSQITPAIIDQALKSIVLNKGDSLTFLNEKGEFSIGILRGKASASFEAKYIGVQAREEYRQQVIEGLEAEIRDLNSHIEEEIIKIKKLQELLALIQEEFRRFPGKDDLETGLKMLQNASLSLENHQKETKRKEEEAEKIYKKLKEVSEQVQEITAKIYLPLNLNAYQEALEAAEDYKDHLSELSSKHTLLVNKRYQLSNGQEQIEDVLQDIDNLFYDLNRLERELKENSEIIASYREILEKTDYQEIEREIDQCINVLKEIPEELQKESKRSAVSQEKYQRIANNLAGLEKRILRAKEIDTISKLSFEKEINLAYVYSREDEEDLFASARGVYKSLRSDDEKRSKIDYITSLTDKYYQNRQYLTEYNLMAEHLFTKDDWQEEIKQIDDLDINQMIEDFKRLEFTARIKGKDVNFYTLVDFIEESIVENEQLLKESDRQLFEDILANTISKKIRARIYHAEQWVKKMNKLMESMDTSSGLSFSLRWKSRVAETEEQMDTRELVEILKSEASLLKEEDFKKLSAHFRSKISEVRKVMEDSGSNQTFHAIMKDILDYRKWFEFRLYYQKTNEPKRELTNNAFNRFSGGEKAMAMYVPLFSAVYARYENGRKDCPRIISLDEAFAGVDSNNIRDMFRLLEELDLSFVINSQVLWGDYDTVPSLSICELVRPNNADVVSVIRYQWDGNVRTLVS
ncbi:TIGR02680 family protein [Natronospora cellulosivora (SeqCode)]